MEEFWSDLCATYADELRALGELGCTYLQFDDTSLAYLNDPRQREQIEQRGTDDVEHLHEQYVRNINRALEGKPEGMAVTTHLCRGNFRSSWAAEGGYDFVAEALFGGLGVDGFFLEYDDARSGGFEPLRFVPSGKYVVLGLVTTKRGELESKDLLKRRIEEASRYVPIEQLCLSPQCGFSSTVEGNALTREQQIAKLELIVETAAEVWGRLMRAAVTEGVGAMSLLERPEPSEPGPGEVVVTPEAVGICGSDYHFFVGELSEEAGGSQFPRVQGHEIGATVAAVGPDCRRRAGRRPAGGGVAAPGVREVLSVQRRPPEHVRLLRADRDPRRRRAAGAAGRARGAGVSDRGRRPGGGGAGRAGVDRGAGGQPRAASCRGERVVVLGAGPIGQCICLVARERGAEVLVVDLQESRLALSRTWAPRRSCGPAVDEVVAFARRRWAAARPGRRWRSTRPGRRRRCGRWSTWSRRPDGRCRSGCPARRSRSGSAA